MEVDELFDEVEGGKFIGGESHPISPRTMQRWRLEGVGPKWVKIGRMVRYRTSDLMTYLDSRVRQSTSDKNNAT